MSESPHPGIRTSGTTAASAAVPSLEEVVLSRDDLWGNAAMAQPNGPSYAFFESLLPPLRYVSAIFRHYPIVLSAPGALCKARYASNGSGINLGAEGSPSWHDVGTPITLRVGPREALYGSRLDRFDGPHLNGGYYPIVESTYRELGCTYAQQVFAPTEPDLAAHGTLLARFCLVEGDRAEVTAHVRGPGKLSFDGSGLYDSEGRQLVWLGGNWRWDAAWNFLKAPLSSSEPLYLAALTDPPPQGQHANLNEETYQAHLVACRSAWDAILLDGAQVDVPEDVVNRAWKTTLVANHMLIRGDRMCYSAHNQYEGIYVGEGGDAVRALLLWGHMETVRRLIPPLVDYSRKGLEYHQAGFKLQMLGHYYRLTRDAEYLEEQKPRWQPEIDRILEHREADSGLFPRERYCGDIATHVYSLNSNANAWRALRDFGALLSDTVESEQGARLTDTAAGFRTRILAAAQESIYRETDPPFIPIALFGEETPYEVLTADKAGTYWDLMAPYVIGSGIFTSGSDEQNWLIEYLQKHGGICMGMIRVRPTFEFWVDKSGVNDLYGLRYTMALLQDDDVDRALVSFYGKLAQGMAPATFAGCEASCLVPADEYGRQLSLPPNSAANAYFLWMLRYLLIQDWDLDDDGRPDTLQLLYSTPRQWMADGQSIRIVNMPTAFGPVSLTADSRLLSGEVTCDLSPPEHRPATTLLRVRLPDGWRPVSASIGPRKLNVDASGTVDISDIDATATIRFRVAN
jgi:hypothetical protein